MLILATGNLMPDTQNKRKLHSTLILDEAVALAKTEGIGEASRIVGISKEVIRQHARVRALENNKTEVIKRRRTQPKYSDEQKLACLKFAEQFKPYLGKRRAWIEAGRRLGVNGRSIEMQFDRGLFKV